MQGVFKQRDSVGKIINDCWKRNKAGKYEDIFIQCIDSGLMYYKDPGYMRLRSMPACKKSDFATVFRYAEEVLAIDKSQLEYFSYITFYYTKDYRKALNWFREFDNLTPHAVDIIMNDNLLSLYGLCYSEMGMNDSALYFLDSLIEKKTDGKNRFMITHRDYLNRGIAHYRLGNFQKALADFNSSVKEYSSCVEGYYFIAKTLMALQSDKQAIRLNLDQALKYYNAGLKNNYPYGEYVDLPNAIFRSDLEDLIEKLSTNSSN
jgi:tetratricopeptide (TPR) repeat protein